MANNSKIDSWGIKRWKCDGLLHRVGGPAMVFDYGSKEWWQHGKLHRLDGPAIHNADGTRYWLIDDVQMTETEFNNHPLVIMHRFVNGE